MLSHRFRWCGNTTCQLAGHYTTCQGQNREDDAHHCVCIHHLLVTLHHLRSAAGLWPDTALADQHSHSHIHTESGAAQLGCQSAYLLPLLLAGIPHVQVSRADAGILTHLTPPILSFSWQPFSALQVVHLLLQVVSQQFAAESLPHSGATPAQQLRLDAHTDHIADSVASLHQQDERARCHLRAAQQGDHSAGHVGGMIAGAHNPQTFRICGPRSHILQRCGVSLDDLRL